MMILNKILSLVALSMMVFFDYSIFIRQFYDLERIMIIYRKALKSWHKSFLFYGAFGILACTVIWYFLFGLVWALLYLNAFLLVLSFSHRKERYVFTRRSFSQLVMILIVVILFAICFFYYDLAYYILFPILYMAPFLIIAISYYLEYPLEFFIRRGYLRSARHKLSLNAGLKVIAITGSFGKTSFKKALFTILSEKYRVIKSPGSVNTLMGLTKFINNELTPYDEIVIFECGVDKPGGMDKLLKLVRPDVAVITAIGEMHLATFKSVENIKKEKLKLAHAASPDGKVFFREGGYLLREDFGDNAVGFTIPEDLAVSPEGSELKTSYNGMEINLTIGIFGKHQVGNVLGAIKIAEYLGLTSKELVKGLAKVTPEPQRLSLRQVKERYILDDAYNSNELGLIEAINVLKKFPPPLAIITPGVIELDNAYFRVNKNIGEHLLGIDWIYVVANEGKHPLITGFLDNGGNPERLKVVANFLEGYNDSLTKDIRTLLIANDTSKSFIK